MGKIMKFEPWKEKTEWMSELLFEMGGFEDLDLPTLLAGGDAGLYYVHTERLMGDGGRYKEYQDNSQELIQHTKRMMFENPAFGEIIGFLTNETLCLFPNGEVDDNCVISGGQTRDWVFSGPVAARLDIPHVSLYKQEDGKEDKIEVVLPGGEIDKDFNLEGKYSIHIVDLITEGSSIYREIDGIKKGWIPMLKNQDVEVKDLVSVVDRMQGGPQNLEAQRVKAHSFIKINEKFLRKYSKFPESGQRNILLKTGLSVS
jgi:hypothetical protein